MDDHKTTVEKPPGATTREGPPLPAPDGRTSHDPRNPHRTTRDSPGAGSSSSDPKTQSPKPTTPSSTNPQPPTPNFSLPPARTVLEPSPGATSCEGGRLPPNSQLPTAHSQLPSPRGLGDWRIVERFPALGGEADIYLIRKGDEDRIFKLYRWGIQPKIEVLDRIIRLASQHPDSFVQVLERGYDPDSKRFYEMEEYFPLGSLRAVLQGLSLGEENISRLFTGLSKALTALHEAGILHLDLKPDNILVRTKDPLQVVLTDFGIASILDAEFSKKMTDIKGTSLYQSPESLSGIVGPKSDWWSLGILLLELLTGKHPFEGLPRQVIYFRLTTAGIPIPASVPARWTRPLKGLLTRNPDRRWGGEEIRRWLSGSEVATFFDDEMARASLESGADAATTGCRRLELPFVFLGRSAFFLEDLLRAFASSPDLWNQGKVLLARGQVSRWLEDNSDVERASRLNDLVDNESEPDRMLFQAIYTFFPALPPVWCGRLLDKRLILELMGKACEAGVFGEEEELLENVFSGRLFQDHARLTGRETGELAEILRLGKLLTATELRKIPLGERCRILLFALQCSYSPEKALDSLETALGGDREFEMILQSVGARGFNDFAWRAGIWRKGDEATWKLAGELFGRPALVVKPALAIIGRMSYVIAHSIGRDLSLRDLLYALAVRSPFDKEMFERWNNLREKHLWLVDVARISYQIPDGIDPVHFLDNQIHGKIANDRWLQFSEYVLPPFFEKLRDGELLPPAHLKIFKEVYPKPWVLIPREAGLQVWADLPHWLLEMPGNALAVTTFDHLVRLKKEYARTIGLYHQVRIGGLGAGLCLIMLINDRYCYTPPIQEDPLMVLGLLVFGLSCLWPLLRDRPWLNRFKGGWPFEPVFPDPVLLRQKSPRPFNTLNRLGYLLLILRLSLLHPDFQRLVGYLSQTLLPKIFPP